MLNEMKRLTLGVVTVGCVLTATVGPATAAGRDLGEPIEREGVRLIARYIQAVDMNGLGHAGHGDGGPSDMHLEAVINATDNSYGFMAGAFVPYLRVEYVLHKEGSDWVDDGVLQPMMAADGPHYATNAGLDGPGRYVLELTVAPPDPAVFPRHIDNETAARPWWEPFTEELEFVFVGSVGKKGGY